jgi:predicted GNAT family acetyltransferase
MFRPDKVSNGFYWLDRLTGQRLGFDDRWHSRVSFDEEDICAFHIKNSLEHLIDNYFSFENKLFCNCYSVAKELSQRKFGFDFGFVMIQCLYVPPQFRKNGVCRRFLKHCMNIAVKTESNLVAVCRPFKHTDEGAAELSLKQAARDFVDDEFRYSGKKFEYLKEEEFELYRNKMRSLFFDLGWKTVDLRNSMENPDLHGDYAVGYFPEPKKTEKKNKHNRIWHPA